MCELKEPARARLPPAAANAQPQDSQQMLKESIRTARNEAGLLLAEVVRLKGNVQDVQATGAKKDLQTPREMHLTKLLAYKDAALEACRQSLQVRALHCVPRCLRTSTHFIQASSAARCSKCTDHCSMCRFSKATATSSRSLLKRLASSWRACRRSSRRHRAAQNAGSCVVQPWRQS